MNCDDISLWFSLRKIIFRHQNSSALERERNNESGVIDVTLLVGDVIGWEK